MGRKTMAGGLSAVALIGLVLTTGTARAADADGKFAVKGAARTVCKHFVKARDERTKNLNLYILYGAWLEGYLSALNERTEGTYDLTSFESTELLATLIYANCKRRPEEPFFDMVRRLVAALGSSRIAGYSEMVPVEGEVKDKEGKAKPVRLRLYRETVRRLQNNLAAQSLYPGAVNGDFDDKTRAALRDFQKASGLPPTGLPDQFTLLKLFRPAPTRKRASAPGGMKK